MDGSKKVSPIEVNRYVSDVEGFQRGVRMDGRRGGRSGTRRGAVGVETVLGIRSKDTRQQSK